MLTLTGLVDKTHQISLSKTEKRHEECYHDVIENPNDYFCVVRLVDFYLNHWCNPNQDNDIPFFCRRAYKKVLNVSYKVYHISYVFNY